LGPDREVEFHCAKLKPLGIILKQNMNEIIRYSLIFFAYSSGIILLDHAIQNKRLRKIIEDIENEIKPKSYNFLELIIDPLIIFEVFNDLPKENLLKEVIKNQKSNKLYKYIKIEQKVLLGSIFMLVILGILYLRLK
jgi:hypothetical protein